MENELQKTSCSMATRLLRIVFGFFLVVVVCSMIGQMLIEYQYQKNSIRKEFSNIQTTFENVLAGEIWNLDENALRSTVEGMIELPVIVGMKICDENGKIIAIGGIVKNGNGAGETGVHIHLPGCSPEDEKIHGGEEYRLEMFEGDFPIIYAVNQEKKVLGRATIYSNTSVILNRVKMSFLMMGVVTVLEVGLLWLIFNLVFVRMLKKPLSELTNAVQSVTLDNLDVVEVTVCPRGRDELGVLAESFNLMLRNLRSEITKRKIADDSLTASEAKLNSILRVAPAGIGLINGRVFDAVNPAMCDLTGYSREELLGQRTRLLYSTEEEYIRGWGRLFALVVQYGMGTIEVSWLRKDGRRIDVLLSAASLVPNDPDGDITFIAMDITERKKAEEDKTKLESQLRQSQKMEAVGQLAGGVAHDFNNMLSVINGYSEMLLVEMDASDPKYERIREIHKAGTRSAELTQQLLAFARKQTIAPKVLDLNATIASMFNMLQRLIGENIEIQWKPSPVVLEVKMDPSQINQIMANLLVNARDAISGAGRIVIELDKIGIDEAFCETHQDFTPGEYVVLEVSDNGCGMGKDTIAHIFEPFFTTKKVGKGTGLGLATVFGVVKQNKGTINVYSEPGKGTTFKIYLPRHKSENLEKEDKPGKAKRITGTETVLLVEDEVSLLKFAKSLLEQLGYTVLTADSPAKAIRLAGEHKGEIHLLMTDVVMPEMSGLELRDRIRSGRHGIKCLFMSGYSADILSHDGVLDEGIHFLEKPFTAEGLSAKLRKVLEVR